MSKPALYSPEAPSALIPQVSAPVNYEAKSQFRRMKGSLWRKVKTLPQFEPMWLFGNSPHQHTVFWLYHYPKQHGKLPK
jgi:hypothetical protein